MPISEFPAPQINVTKMADEQKSDFDSSSSNSYDAQVPKVRFEETSIVKTRPIDRMESKLSNVAPVNLTKSMAEPYYSSDK